MMMSINTINNNNNNNNDEDDDQSCDEDKELDEKEAEEEAERFDLFNSLGKLKIVPSEELQINKSIRMSSMESSPSSLLLSCSSSASADTTTAKTTMMMMMMCLQNNNNNNNNKLIDIDQNKTNTNTNNNSNPFQLKMMPNYLLNSNVTNEDNNIKDLFGNYSTNNISCKCSSLIKRHHLIKSNQHHNNFNKFNNNTNNNNNNIIINNFNYNKNNKLFDMEHKIHQPINLFKKRSTKHRKILKEPVLTLIENCIHQQNQSTYKYFETNSNLNLLSQFNLNKIGYKASVAEYGRITLTTSPSALITTLTPSSQSYNLYKINNNCLKLDQQQQHPHHHKQINVIKINDNDQSYAIKPSFMRNKTTTTLTTTMATSYSLSSSSLSSSLLACSTSSDYATSPHSSSSSNLCTSTPSTTLSLSSAGSSSLMSFTVGNASSQNNNNNNNSNSCSQQARLNQTNCDVTIDELACYFETLVHIPKKMSTMAEMMYI